jgi:hypothetical protein
LFPASFIIAASETVDVELLSVLPKAFTHLTGLQDPKKEDLVKRFLSAIVLVGVLASSAAYGQEILNKPQPDPKTTPAYSLLILRKVKVQAELEDLVVENGPEWPKAKALQFELDALKREMKKMSEIIEPQVSKLTAGYGELILRRVSLDAEVKILLIEQGSDWPETMTKQRELELLDKEIRKVLN